MPSTHTLQSGNKHHPIWLTNPDTPVLVPTSNSFECLPPTLQQLLLQLSNKLVSAREPVPLGTESVNLLLQNLCNHTVPNTLTFEENVIAWFRSFLLDQAHAGNMTGFDNGILIVHGMCPTV